MSNASIAALRVYVVEINEIIEHPNADRLEILQLCRPDPTAGIWTEEIVAGKHYRVGQLGVYLPPGCLLPGWLAEDMWLVGSGPSANRWFPVEPKVMRGIPSAGLFAGQTYKKVREDVRSVRRYDKLKSEGGSTIETTPPSENWITWPIWQARWKLGDDVTDYIGVQCPSSSVSEQPVFNREVGQTANVPGLDSSLGLQTHTVCWCGEPASTFEFPTPGRNIPLCKEHSTQYEIKTVRPSQYGPAKG